MNKQLEKITGVTDDDYKQWCLDNHKPSYLNKTKRDFYGRILDGRLVKDAAGKKLLRKNKNRKRR